MKLSTGRMLGFWGACLISAVFAGCGDGGPSSSDAAATQAPPSKDSSARQFISVGAAPIGGVFFSIGGAIADILNQFNDQNWQTTAEATGGTMENIRRLDQGDIQLAMANDSITYFAVRGEAGWDKAYPVQSVMTLFPNFGQFVVRADSDIDTITDLKGKRVVCGPEGAGFEYFLEPLFAAHNLPFDQIDHMHASQQSSVEFLGDRAVDATFIAGGVPTPALSSAASSMDIRFVAYDEAAVKSLSEQYSFFQPATVPANTYKGQNEPFETLNCGSAQLLCASGADEDFIYRVTKILYEHRDKMAEMHPSAKAVTPENAPRYAGVDFHPGAVRYYREIGIWPEK